MATKRTAKRRMVKIENTMPIPTPTLRRMLSWVSKQVGLTRPLSRAKFRNRSKGSGSCGCAWPSGRISINIDHERAYPYKWCAYKRASKPQDGGDYLTIADRWETIVILVAHEVAHVWHFRRGIDGRGCEEIADARARMVLRKFREERSMLLPVWEAEVKRASTPEKTPQEKLTVLQAKRQAAAERKLAEWEKRLASTKAKVQRYRRTVRYYERQAEQRTAAAPPVGG